MDYQALYRKYRPMKFSDVVDQDSILKILTNSLKEGHISHAYLFSGPRGTGKTTIAKLLAKSVNCLNLNKDFSICGECENCLDILNNSSDIIEIDAASNNGVDEIRELKSKINLVPNKLKYKVYIIDEVHMLSISAFNALLKTLEEPPSHVIFILATTEFYKVPETIVSRCQCLNFTRIKSSSIEKRLKEISNIEKIKISDDAIKEIAEYSNGGMRDALGMLDKLSSYSLKEITADDFYKINGLISRSDIDDFLNNILNSNIDNVINTLKQFDELGYDLSKLLEKMMEEARNIMIDYYQNNQKENIDINKIFDLIMCFNETYNLLKEAQNRKIIIEVKLLKFMNSVPNNKETNVIQTNDGISQEISLNNFSNKKGNMNLKIKSPKYVLNLDTKKIRIDNTFSLANKSLKNAALLKWKNLSTYLTNERYSYVAGLLKDCSISVVSKSNMILTSKYESLIDEIYQNYNDVISLIDNLMESDYKIVVLTELEFNLEVDNYKKHIKDDNYYQLKEEEKPLIIFKDLIEKEENLGYTNLVDKAINVFGTDIVEIEEER